jgi:hypothetical protein
MRRGYFVRTQAFGMKMHVLNKLANYNPKFEDTIVIGHDVASSEPRRLDH